MSLLDEWEGAVPSYGEALGPSEGLSADPGIEEGAEAFSPRRSLDSALFSLETVERHIARGRGQITAVAAASDIVVLVTARAFLLRYDLSQGLAPVAEMELSKAADARATGVWIDSTGSHLVCSITTANAAEAHYVHGRWQKSRTLGKLRGILVSCVAWDIVKGSETATGDVLLGTNAGMLFDFSIESSDKKERKVNRVLDLGDVREPIKGLQQLPLPGNRLMVLASTPSRLYAFTGSTPVQTLFAGYPDPADLVNYVEFPAEGHSLGQLHTYAQAGSTKPERFAWLSEAGIFHGHLDLARTAIPASELDYLPRRGLLPYPALGASHGPEPALAMALMQYHHVLLFPNRLVMVNCVSEAPVQEISLLGRAAPHLAGSPAGLAADDASSSVFLFTTEGLHEVAAHDEGRDMWSIFLRNGNFSDAFRQCRNQAQRDTVRAAEAEARMAEGDPVGAARLWGKMTSSHPPFEDVALRLVDSGSPDALHTLLATRLDALPPSDRAQVGESATVLSGCTDRDADAV